MSTSGTPSTETIASTVNYHILKWVSVGLGILLLLALALAHPLGREAGIHLAGLVGPRAVPYLLWGVQDQNEGVQLVANTKISSMGPAALPALIAQLDHPRGSIRAAAAQMLSSNAVHSGRQLEVSQALLKTLDDSDPNVRVAAIQAQANLSRSARKALPQIKALLNDPIIKIQLSALHAVGAIDPASPETLSIVLDQLRHANPKVRTAACFTLEHIGARDPRAISALIKTLQDPVVRVRMAAVDYLGKTGPNGRLAITALQDVADHDPDASIRDVAKQSIKNVNERTPK